MSKFTLLLAVFGVGAMLGATPVEAQKKKLKLVPKLDLNANRPVGKLGLAVGTITTIEGMILSDSARGLRVDSGKSMMRVEKVDGRVVKKPFVIQVVRFTFTQFKIPKSGSKVRVVGYETGGYTGIPSEAFKYIPRVATTDFRFKTWLQICSIEKLKKK